MKESLDAPWSHAADKVVGALQSDAASGLSSTEAAVRLSQVGPNELPSTSAHAPLRLFLSQFADWMVGLLAAAAIVSGLVGDLTDSILIALIVLGNAIIGFAQEWKAERAVDALKRMSHPTATVLRDGQQQSIDAAKIVPGDVLLLNTGDAVPADARLLKTIELEVDESPLTGESLPVEKHVQEIGADTVLPDRANMVYSGTAVTRGRAEAVVVATALRTELGQIAGLLQQAQSGPTPVQQRLTRLSAQLAMIVLGICVVIFAAGFLREPSENWSWKLASEMLLTAVSL
ncbi:MAG: HAD-IC family P-type ATPase, partial [Planctomycetaceae bacterium]|nr:HAD-IC family P-type ATPase [Planctomycetaceae bacterium]